MVNSFPTLEIFTKVACHLARGGKVELISKPFAKLKQVKYLQPRIENNGYTIIGNVIYIDSVGNLVCNITQAVFEAYRNNRPYEILVKRQRISKILKGYKDIIDTSLSENQRKGDGDLLAIFNANQHLELAIYKGSTSGFGSAASLFGLKYQDQITLNFL